MSASIGTPGGTSERPAIFFAEAAEFRTWLEAHHGTETELWMGLYKKHVADPGLTWRDAVPEALCFGWIDSLSQPIDDDSRRQRWTPRKATSMWSAVNVAHVERLIAEGRMQPAGLAAFERRRADRTAAYSHENARELAPEYASLVAASPAATAFLAESTPSYRRQAAHWVMSAKQESTRERRAAQLVDDSASGRLIPQARAGRTPAWVARAAVAAASAAD